VKVRRGRQQYIVVAILFVFLLPPAASWTQTSDSDCLACHGDKDLVTTDSAGVERSLFVDATQMENSVHAGFECVICHADIAEIPHAERLAAVACETCHNQAVAEIAASAHGTKAAEAPTCRACHGSHDIRAVADSLSLVHPRRLAFTCGHCHANLELVAKYKIPIKNPLEAYTHSIHGRLALAGIDSAATCSSCHGSHKILAANDPASKAFHFNIAQTCGQCHRRVTDEFAKSVHGAAVARGSRDAPVCTDCHSEHAIESPAVAAAPTSPKNVAVETCGHCHASTRLAKKYGMRRERLSTFADSYHGLALRSGRVAVANCGSCHGVHNILPSSDARSMIHPANLASTCGQCHPNAGENFARGPVHLTAEDKEGKAVAIIRGIYIGLIVIIIGAMLIHNGLDFIRKSKYLLQRE